MAMFGVARDPSMLVVIAVVLVIVVSLVRDGLLADRVLTNHASAEHEGGRKDDQAQGAK